MFIPVILSGQILPGTFEFALDHLVGHELDQSALYARFRNDAIGGTAFDPRVMLKIGMLAFSKGLQSSRRIESACRVNVLFMALRGDAQPSCTHIARFVRQLGDEIQSLFSQVLMTCDRLGLIGWPMFVIDDRTARCPQGKILTGGGTCNTHNRGAQVLLYKAKDEDCRACPQRGRCLKNPEAGRGRQVSRFGRALVDETDPSERMRRAIDSPRGRRLYGRRIATVEPVFANLRHHKGLDRFTLRGQKKVSTQWQLFCLVHNMEKLARRSG